MLCHPCILAGPQQRGTKSEVKRTLGVTMMLLVPMHGFEDCPGFLNSTGRLGPERRRKCYVTLASSRVPNKGGQNQMSKRTLVRGHHDAPSTKAWIQRLSRFPQ